MSTSFWIIAGILFLIIEILTPGVFFFACLSIGAFAGALMQFLRMPFWMPWLAFVLISIISIYFIKPFAQKLFIHKKMKTNVDALIGVETIVIEPIIPPNLGTVKIDGEFWRVEASEPIDKGSKVIVKGIKGTHLIVEISRGL